MNKADKEVARNLPQEFRPIGAWAYWGYSILFAIPIVGFIALIICACSRSNINRRSFARSYFIRLLIVAIVLLILFLCMRTLFMGYFAAIKAYIMQFIGGGK